MARSRSRRCDRCSPADRSCQTRWCGLTACRIGSRLRRIRIWRSRRSSMRRRCNRPAVDNTTRRWLAAVTSRPAGRFSITLRRNRSCTPDSGCAFARQSSIGSSCSSQTFCCNSGSAGALGLDLFQNSQGNPTTEVLAIFAVFVTQSRAGMAVRRARGELAISSHARQARLRPDRRRFARHADQFRPRDGEAFRQVGLKADAGNRLHHRRVHRAEAGASRHHGRHAGHSKLIKGGSSRHGEEDQYDHEHDVQAEHDQGHDPNQLPE